MSILDNEGHDPKGLGNALSRTDAADLREVERLRLENWQLKGALGYPVPGDIPCGDFKCGLCEAREAEIAKLTSLLTGGGSAAWLSENERLRAALTEALFFLESEQHENVTPAMRIANAAAALRGGYGQSTLTEK